MDSNHRPRAYQARALTTWAMSPFSFFDVSRLLSLTTFVVGGDDGNRTHDPLLAGQVLSQLSYTPIWVFKWIMNSEEWIMNNFGWKASLFLLIFFLPYAIPYSQWPYGHSKLNNNRFILCSSVLSSSVKFTSFFIWYFRTYWFWSISKLTSCR